MLLGRYNYISRRLSELYNMIQHRQFTVWVLPTLFMDIDELRSRPTYYRDDHVGDHSFYETPQSRSMTVAQLVDLLPNMTKETDIGWLQANTVVPQLYEGIQEYIMLWCEIITQVPEVPHPSLEELKLLENFAFILFNPYSQIRPMLDELERQNMTSEHRKMENMGLASWMGLFKQEGMGFKRTAEGISFVSYIDQLKASPGWGGGYSQPVDVPTTSDSLLNEPQDSGAGLTSWFMMKE